MVALIPRSFCNGTSFLWFREFLLNNTSIKDVHIFGSRSETFSHDSVLQENVVLHCVKGEEQGRIRITSSKNSKLPVFSDSSKRDTLSRTEQIVDFQTVVCNSDENRFFRFSTTKEDIEAYKLISKLPCTLSDIGVEASTGPIVDFRQRKHLLPEFQPGAAPLLYPTHLNGSVRWPLPGKKANAIVINEQTARSLWHNEGYYVTVKRFTTKEERKRIFATLYDSSLPGNHVGFDNKINVLHFQKKGIDALLAKGLFAYLNCSLLDRYYRQFGGHTQVNATDLRSFRFPPIEVLKTLGMKVELGAMNQKNIDKIVEKELCNS